MAASRLCSAAAIAAAFTSMSLSQNRAYADSRFRFPFYSSSPSPPPSDSPANQSSSDSSKSNKAEPDEPKGSGFDPEALERAAKALRDINSSPHSNQVFDLMRKQEKTRLAEVAAEKSQYEAVQAHTDIERQRKLAEDQRNLLQTHAQTKAQSLRYEDELARKRQQTDHEAQRHHNVELVKMQEESSIRKERTRIATEEQIQAQHRQTEKERAELERETIRVKAMAEAEGRAHEAKLTEEQNRRLLMERINGEREKWLAAINTMFSHIEGGFRTLLTDRNKLIMTVGGATALAAGVYTTREGARVTWGYINRMLGQPSLIRESSMGRFPWASSVSQLKKRISGAAAASVAEGKKPIDNVVLHPSLKTRIERLARATSNTKTHQAPFRNMMFYGPPGTGKTMVAREIAWKSGLDYAMMTGGDVAPLGSQAVTKIHQIFDWAKKSNKGLLLFIDEADAFLCERNSTYMSEAQRSALNALLFRTGDQSRDIVLVLATNRPGDLDSAVTDRIDEVIEFPLPGEEERFKLLNLYVNKYLKNSDNDKDTKHKWSHLFKKLSQKITVNADLTDQVISEAAKKTEGFSGREIAKLVAGVQAGVYGRKDCVLDSQLFEEIVAYKVEEHHQRHRLASEGFQPLLFSS
ncbi:PREDICTED: ATPase family AAA domain-containing protein 3C-like [Camelina sativa]|uniref:ATPase family AAA domain-containing protein 3C-like n=1 Tax=Camelina sativa TaxID=90675 RepID=A0ABM0U820_CAMSA|nr:PREDICTED: ATPase family AAA domain-containing protein 3C-like [Camelina sativa]